MRWTLPLLAAAFAATHCERAPREDFASRPVTPSAPVEAAQQPQPEEKAPATVARCVLATPAEPAPPVPVGPAPGCPPDPELASANSSGVVLAHVSFPDASEAVVDAEVVRSPHDTARGLMYRRKLPQNRGMLFDLGTRDDHKFWMHNTCIPLDLLYIDADGLIVGIVENAPTLNDDARGVGCPSVYVLEVNAGWTRRHGVRAGQHLSLPAEVTGR